MDYIAFKFLNDWAGLNHSLDYFFIFLAKYLIYLVAALAFWRVLKSPPPGWSFKKIKPLGASLAGAYIFNFLIGLIYKRPRPFISHQVHQLVYPSTHKSFPSDHATMAFTLALYAYFLDQRAWPLIGLAFLVAAGRVFVGVHFPSDVLAGAFIGLVFAWLGKKLHDDHRVASK